MDAPLSSEEIDWIERFDKAKVLINDRIDWRLSSKRRKREFALITDEHVQDLEGIIKDVFEVKEPEEIPVP